MINMFVAFGKQDKSMQIEINVTDITYDARTLFALVCKKIKRQMEGFLGDDIRCDSSNLTELLKLQIRICRYGDVSIMPVFKHLGVSEGKISYEVNEEEYLHRYVNAMVVDDVGVSYLTAIAELNGKYAIRLYELILSHHVEAFDIEIKELREFLGFSEAYSNDTVLEYLRDAEEEINEKHVFTYGLEHIELRREGGEKRKGKLIGLSFRCCSR